MSEVAVMPNTNIIAAADAETIRERLAQHAHSARGTVADNTARTRRADTRVWMDWCAMQGRTPLPAAPDTVAAFIDDMAIQKKPATVRHYASTIAYLHRAAGVPNPCENDHVRNALKRMARMVGTAQRQAAPMNDIHIARMLALPCTSLRNIRDRALIAIAYGTLCRRSELIELRAEDLSIDKDGGGTILVRRSKTDQEGAGQHVGIEPDCMKHLRAWLDAAGITSGHLFRATPKGGKVGGPLTGVEVARIYKRAAQAIGLSEAEVAGISGHSTRVGAAQDMVRLGCDMASAMQAGRWKTPQMLARYSARLTARRGGMAQVADRRVQF